MSELHKVGQKVRKNASELTIEKAKVKALTRAMCNQGYTLKFVTDEFRYGKKKGIAVEFSFTGEYTDGEE